MRHDVPGGRAGLVNVGDHDAPERPGRRHPGSRRVRRSRGGLGRRRRRRRPRGVALRGRGHRGRSGHGHRGRPAHGIRRRRPRRRPRALAGGREPRGRGLAPPAHPARRLRGRSRRRRPRRDHRPPPADPPRGDRRPHPPRRTRLRQPPRRPCGHPGLAPPRHGRDPVRRRHPPSPLADLVRFLRHLLAPADTGGSPDTAHGITRAWTSESLRIRTGELTPARGLLWHPAPYGVWTHHAPQDGGPALWVSPRHGRWAVLLPADARGPLRKAFREAVFAPTSVR